MHFVWEMNIARNMPEAEAVGAAFLGAAFAGVSDLLSDLLANSEPTALSKKPPPVGPARRGSITQPSAETSMTRGSSACARHELKSNICHEVHSKQDIPYGITVVCLLL